MRACRQKIGDRDERLPRFYNRHHCHAGNILVVAYQILSHAIPAQILQIAIGVEILAAGCEFPVRAQIRVECQLCDLRLGMHADVETARIDGFDKSV